MRLAIRYSVLALTCAALLASPAVFADDAANVAPVRDLPNLAGKWARLQVTTAVSDVPVVGDVSSETVGIVLLSVRQEGDRLELKEQICALKNESLGGAVEARFPVSFLEALSGNVKTARLVRQGDAIRYLEDEDTRVHGARLEDPLTDDLPQSQGDPRVRDADGDGEPGMTVRVDGIVDGEIYVVQRTSAEFHGELLSPKKISGAISWRSEQSVVGASSSFLESNPDARPHPDPDKSFFRMRRVPSSATCPQVVRLSRRLFGI